MKKFWLAPVLVALALVFSSLCITCWADEPTEAQQKSKNDCEYKDDEATSAEADTVEARENSTAVINEWNWKEKGHLTPGETIYTNQKSSACQTWVNSGAAKEEEGDEQLEYGNDNAHDGLLGEPALCGDYQWNQGNYAIAASYYDTARITGYEQAIDLYGDDEVGAAAYFDKAADAMSDNIDFCDQAEQSDTCLFECQQPDEDCWCEEGPPIG
ncbi:MAG: hypothetical protein ACYS83_11125 [Planctomycetota bacterium]|jgi:hypothetical protein